jgi:hypothetical protein
MNLEKLKEPFPPGDIKQRKGHNGEMLDYVEVHRVIQRLNEAFAGLWNFKVLEKERTDKEVIVLGELTAEGITKQQYGSKDITFKKNTKDPVCIGDDFKAAASDALKKCATLFEIALHLYENGQKGKQANRQGRKRTQAQPESGDTKASGDGDSAPPGRISKAQMKEIWRLCSEGGLDPNKWVEETFKTSLEALSYEQGKEAIATLNERAEGQQKPPEGEKQEEKPKDAQKNGKVAAQQKEVIKNLLGKLGVKEAQVEAVIKEKYQVTLDDLSYEQRTNIIKKLSEEVNKKKQAEK